MMGAEDIRRNSIGVAVSTMDARVLRNRPLLEQLEVLAWPTVIVNQCRSEHGARMAGKWEGESGHVQIVDSDSSGLCASRNLAIRHLEVDWVVLCDDDVSLSVEELHELRDQLMEWPFDCDPDEVGALSTKLKKSESVMWRNYPAERKAIQGSHAWNGLRIQSINSMELVLHRKAMLNWRLSFDEDFGLGATAVNGGEEAILLHDILESGGIILPMNLAPRLHPEDSSGQQMNSKAAFTQGAVHRKIFGALLWAGLFGWFALKRGMRGGFGPRGVGLAMDYWRGGQWSAGLD